ncbi:hypothetical protein VVR84_01550 [Kocuria carniphila]|uniref:AbiEi antitoxin C-terminal domain-containing protein n=1 Tax=Kocuria carniphila TaxID=262208 RepID=A0ABV3UXN8_9MICC|nr:hypothetical protein [Kocuria carniphila]MCT1801485.1 hypothetical protein [Kocuria carniphila]PZP31105.1 MAG: hypothetical protein DI613_09720 [Kocuria rhizophila]
MTPPQPQPTDSVHSLPPRSGAKLTPVLRPGHPFSGPELSAMVSDGILNRILLDAHVPVGTALTRVSKLHVLRAVIPAHLQRRGVLGRLGAAWFYDCAEVPEPLPILVAKDARTTTTLPRGFSLHQTAFNPFDRVVHEDLAVTSPLRTAVDVALHVPGSEGTGALHWLMASPHLHCPPELVLAALEAVGKKPGRRQALARVRKVGRAVERGYEATGR